MSRWCSWCRGDGLVFIRYRESPGYDVAVCLCPKGEWWKKKWQLKAWVALQDPKPVQVGRLEEFYTPQELNVLTTTPGPVPSVCFRTPVQDQGAPSVGG